METPPIYMTVYYRIKSIVIFPFKIAIHFVVLSFNSLTSFLSRFRVTFEVTAFSLTIPDKTFQETKFEGKKIYSSCKKSPNRNTKNSNQFCLQGRPDILVWSWLLKWQCLIKIKIPTQRGHLMLVNLKIVMVDAVTSY